MSGDAQKSAFDWGDTSPLGLGVPSTPEAGPSSVANLQGAASAEAAKAAAAASPRKRGRPRGDRAGSTGDQRDVSSEVNRAVIAQLDALHDPEAWGALLALPGDAAHAITGRDRWEIKKDERRTLGVTGSAFARTLMITNPRALAAMMLAGALFSVYGARAIAEVRELRAKRAAETAGKPDAAQS